MEGLKIGNRRIEVTNIDVNDITFKEKWFALDDIIINNRTNSEYLIDTVYKKGYKVKIVGIDEYYPYDIIEGDYFYIK